MRSIQVMLILTGYTYTTPDESVTLYYIHNRALLACDTSLHKKDKEAEQ